MKKIVILTLLIGSLLRGNDNIELAGDYIQIILPITAYVTTLAIDDKEGEISFYKSFASTVATTHALKYTVQEERPNNTDNNSFPSGHTSASFQGASFIHFRYGLKYAILPYLGAAFVGYSRVYAEKHYIHDVIAGAAIGSAFTWYFTQPYKVKGLELKPVVFNSIKNNQNLYGINIRW